MSCEKLRGLVQCRPLDARLHCQLLPPAELRQRGRRMPHGHDVRAPQPPHIGQAGLQCARKECTSAVE